MSKIATMSRYLAIIVTAVMIIKPVSTILFWAAINTTFLRNNLSYFDSLATPFGFIALNSIPWTSFSQAVACLSELVGMIPFLCCLWYLSRIFKTYSTGMFFTETNAQYYHRIAWLFYIHAFITHPLSSMIMSIATTLANPPGQRTITLSFGTHNVELLFLGSIAIVISWIMLEATKMQEEQTFTI